MSDIANRGLRRNIGNLKLDEDNLYVYEATYYGRDLLNDGDVKLSFLRTPGELRLHVELGYYGGDFPEMFQSIDDLKKGVDFIKECSWSDKEIKARIELVKLIEDEFNRLNNDYYHNPWSHDIW